MLPLVSYFETVSHYGAQCNHFSVGVIDRPGGRQLKGDRGYFDLEVTAGGTGGSWSLRIYKGEC